MTRQDPNALLGPSSRPCTYPGCNRVLHKGHGTYDRALCKDHGGISKGKATKTRMVPYVPPETRPGVRVIDVPYGTSNSSVAGVAKVSVAREPWL